jgi:hypothetical protein
MSAVDCGTDGFLLLHAWRDVESGVLSRPGLK